jgi:hypothetical protein
MMTEFMAALMSVSFLFDFIMIIIKLNKVIQPNN